MNLYFTNREDAIEHFLSNPIRSIGSDPREYNLDEAAREILFFTPQMGWSPEIMAGSEKFWEILESHTMIDRNVTWGVFDDVLQERRRQLAEYGDNSDLEDGTGPQEDWIYPAGDAWTAQEVEEKFRAGYEEYEARHGKPTWMLLVREEVAEVFKEDHPERLREELVQVAALCVSWIEKLDAR